MLPHDDALAIRKCKWRRPFRESEKETEAKYGFQGGGGPIQVAKGGMEGKGTCAGKW